MKAGAILKFLLMTILCIFDYNRYLRMNHIDSGLMRAATVFPEGKNVCAVITSKCSLND